MAASGQIWVSRSQRAGAPQASHPQIWRAAGQPLARRRPAILKSTTDVATSSGGQRRWSLFRQLLGPSFEAWAASNYVGAFFGQPQAEPLPPAFSWWSCSTAHSALSAALSTELDAHFYEAAKWHKPETADSMSAELNATKVVLLSTTLTLFMELIQPSTPEEVLRSIRSALDTEGALAGSQLLHIAEALLRQNAAAARAGRDAQPGSAAGTRFDVASTFASLILTEEDCRNFVLLLWRHNREGLQALVRTLAKALEAVGSRPGIVTERSHGELASFLKLYLDVVSALMFGASQAGDLSGSGGGRGGASSAQQEGQAAEAVRWILFQLLDSPAARAAVDQKLEHYLCSSDATKVAPWMLLPSVAARHVGLPARLIRPALAVAVQQRLGPQVDAAAAEAAIAAHLPAALLPDDDVCFHPYGCWNGACTCLTGTSEAALKVNLCAGCNVAAYCSAACQHADLGARHKRVCKLLLRQQQQVEQQVARQVAQLLQVQEGGEGLGT